MTEENTNAKSNQKKNFFRLMEGFDVASALQGFASLQQLLGNYRLNDVSAKWQDLAKMPARAVQDINDKDVVALEADVKSLQDNAEADAVTGVKTILGMAMDVGFADADKKLAADAGASEAEVADMDAKENSLLKILSDEDRERLENEGSTLVLALAGPYYLAQNDAIRTGGNSIEARKKRALDDVQTVGTCITGLIDTVGSYDGSADGINTDFGSLSSIFYLAAKDKTDPQVEKALTLIAKYADRAPADLIKVLKLVCQGGTAFLYMQAEAEALQAAGASAADMQELSDKANEIMTAAMSNANSEKLGQISVLGAAVVLQPLKDKLAQRQALES